MNSGGKGAHSTCRDAGSQHPVAWGQIRYAGAYLGDGTDGLVAEDPSECHRGHVAGEMRRSIPQIVTVSTWMIASHGSVIDESGAARHHAAQCRSARRARTKVPTSACSGGVPGPSRPGHAAHAIGVLLVTRPSPRWRWMGRGVNMMTLTQNDPVATALTGLVTAVCSAGRSADRDHDHLRRIRPPRTPTSVAAGAQHGLIASPHNAWCVSQVT